jgi:hypothetical protein
MRKHVLRPINEFALPTDVRHDLANAGERAIRGIGVGDPRDAVIADVRAQMPSGMSPVRPTNHRSWCRVGPLRWLTACQTVIVMVRSLGGT